MTKLKGRCIDCYPNRKGTPILIIGIPDHANQRVRNIKVTCFGRDGVEDQARAVAVGDEIEIEAWPLEARKWEPKDGSVPADPWMQDLKAAKVTVTRKAATESAVREVESEEIPF
jgi:hypothetical protein